MRPIIRRFLALFPVALLPVAMLAVFGTFTVYSGNIDEFDIAFATLLSVFLVPGLGLALLLTLIGLPLREGIRKRYLCVLFATGMLLWFQGHFLMWDYGVLDGRGIVRSGFGNRAKLDLLLWLGVLVAAVVYFRKVARVAVIGSLAMLIAGSVPLVLFAIGDQPGWRDRGQVRTDVPDELFTYSRTHNIVHVIMDAAQTDVFLELVGEHGLEQAFDGFVVFRDTAAASRHTSFALPAIFSGEVYDGTVAPDDYYRAAMDRGIHRALHAQGYRVNMVPIMDMGRNGHDLRYSIPVTYRAGRAELIRGNATLLLDIALFRHAPHMLRYWIHDEGNWRISRWLNLAENTSKSFQHKRFFADYINRLDPGLEEPAYHFLHFWPPHPPFVTRADGRYAGGVQPMTRENYRNEFRPMVLLFADLLERLEELGLYDSSLILLHGDHGGGFEPEFMPRRSLALLAVKPRGRRGPLQLSAAPASVADVAATIAAEEGLEADPGGQPVFALDPEAPRVRRMISLSDGAHMDAVRITGSMYSPDSFRRIDAVTIEREASTYTYGERVNVGLMGRGSAYLADGWSAPDDRICWSNAHRAGLRIPVDSPPDDLRLTLRMIPHVHPEELPEQRIEVRVNGHHAGTAVAEEQRTLTAEFDVPRDWIQDAELEITFRLPDAASPVELGTGPDPRLLGVALIDFRLAPRTAADGPR